MPTDPDLLDYDAIVRLVATLCATRLIGLPMDSNGELTQPPGPRHLPPEEIRRIEYQMSMLLFTFRRASSIRYQTFEVAQNSPDWLQSWHLQGAMPHHPEFIIGLTKRGKFDLAIRREWHGKPQELFSGEGLTLGEVAMHVAVMIYGSPEGQHLIRTEDIPGFWDLHATFAPHYICRPERLHATPA